MLNFTQKEMSLLKDEQKQEQLCVQKYQSFASQAQDPALKTLLTNLSQQEQQHLNTINQLISGQMPATGGSQQQGTQQAPPPAAQNGQQSGEVTFPGFQSQSQSDALLCEDLLSTEKHVSSTYNTAIFEFKDPNVRQVLNHIQKEEQQHGESLYQYMAAHGMYNA